MNKTRRYFCAEISEEQANNITLSQEHKAWWVEPIEEAINDSRLEKGKREMLEAFLNHLLRKGLKELIRRDV